MTASAGGPGTPEPPALPAGGDTGETLAALDALVRQLRVACAWDREQDERSIVPHTLDEAYEVADAAMAGSDAKLADELGDLLFQVFFLALLLEERGVSSLPEVAAGLHRKLVRRHPHVYGEAVAESAGAVRSAWAVRSLVSGSPSRAAISSPARVRHCISPE